MTTHCIIKLEPIGDLLNPQQLASEMTTVESNANNANEVFVPPGRNNRGITLPLHGKQHVLNAVY